MQSYAKAGAGSTLMVFAFTVAGAGAYLNYKGAHFMVPGSAGEIVAGLLLSRSSSRSSGSPDSLWRLLPANGPPRSASSC